MASSSAIPTTFADAWLSDLLNSSETETLTKALQTSLFSNNNNTNTNTVLNNMINSNNPDTPTLSNVSGGSDPSEPVPKRSKNPVLPPTGRVSKRKSRASKKTQTTYITADPANFRQMVQQVTGVRFPGAGAVPPVLRPEPQRPGLRAAAIAMGGCLPTLDTSAFLLDAGGQMVGSSASPELGFAPPCVPAAGEGGSSAGIEGFEGFGGFPTLESSFARVVESGFVTF